MALFRASVDPEARRVLADSAVASFRRYLALVEAGHRDGGEVPSGERIEQHILTLYLDAGEPERVVAIDRSYIEAQVPAVREQLMKAGVRLGALLSQALEY